MVFTAPEESVLEQLSTLEKLDSILDECLRFSARRPIMVQFNPSSKFIWRQWKGTVFAETWKSVARMALWASFVYFVFLEFPFVKQAFTGFNSPWAQLCTVSTFTLTFYLNEAYSVWRNSLTRCRTLQGRLNDLVMALAGFAQRVDGKEGSEFTPASRSILQVVSRYIRLFNILSYASLTRSHRPLLTPRGMRRMENRGLMTNKERQVLKNLPVPATQRHNAVLMWILRLVVDGRKAGHLDGGFGFEQQMMSKIQEIRAQANSMESTLRGRMPFAYAHLVQILIDVILWSSPLMFFSNGMSLHLGVIGSVMLTSSYQGLFDLAKQLLDPFHNENFWKGEDALVVDTLIAETNAGSIRWMNCLDEMPISYENIRRGQIQDFILPDEGFSKEDADAANEERELRKKIKREERKRVALQERDRNKTVRDIFVEQALEEVEAAYQELESTKLILEAPPGSDFVPGLDDKNETIAIAEPVNGSEDVTISNKGSNTQQQGHKKVQMEEFVSVESLGTFMNQTKELISRIQNGMEP